MALQCPLQTAYASTIFPYVFKDDEDRLKGLNTHLFKDLMRMKKCGGMVMKRKKAQRTFNGSLYDGQVENGDIFTSFDSTQLRASDPHDFHVTAQLFIDRIRMVRKRKRSRPTSVFRSFVSFSNLPLALCVLVAVTAAVLAVVDEIVERMSTHVVMSPTAKRVIGGTRGIRKIGAGLLILGTASLFFDHSAAFNGNQIFYSEKPWNLNMTLEGLRSGEVFLALDQQQIQFARSEESSIAGDHRFRFLKSSKEVLAMVCSEENVVGLVFEGDLKGFHHMRKGADRDGCKMDIITVSSSEKTGILGLDILMHEGRSHSFLVSKTVPRSIMDSLNYLILTTYGSENVDRWVSRFIFAPSPSLESAAVMKPMEIAQIALILIIGGAFIVLNLFVLCAEFAWFAATIRAVRRAEAHFPIV
ncbi:hypothetical protein PRIPAC_86424 [Pristionchus pacificus]|uniref:Uncharacterized protein n=1 Tax=Pristionchus pacificus TaxID=54126 RepID=A0A2A6BME9_PRIPA|nr:hypothetical protein PRIPAC_86424 [Pristionchus pacificus]|eukprot:PDM67075.1 hypothetical protein PRIPAC_48492 [Pristionchus pacificus]